MEMTMITNPVNSISLYATDGGGVGVFCEYCLNGKSMPLYSATPCHSIHLTFLTVKSIKVLLLHGSSACIGHKFGKKKNF